jgi:hypothetical protein
MVDTVSQIDLGDVYSLGFRYSEKLYVALGNGQSVADKIRMAWEIIRLLHETSAGTIDVSDPSKGYFKPGK